MIHTWDDAGHLATLGPYENLLARVLADGERRENRTGTDTIGVFGEQLRFHDTAAAFPLVTSKKVFFRGVVEELAWFLRGETHVGSLQAAGVHIWDAWATVEQCARFGRDAGELGPIYSHQWRNFGARPLDDRSRYDGDGFDQIAWLERSIAAVRENPAASVARRLILTGWHPREAEQVALPPCHTLAQFHVGARAGTLSCHLYMRSADLFLGVPWNIASYAMFTRLLAHNAGLRAGDLVVSFGDAHVYVNHVEQVREQIGRAHRPLPTLRVHGTGSHDGPAAPIDLRRLRAADLEVVGYDPHPALRGEVAV